MWKYLEPFNSVQTMIILVYKQISTDSYENQITFKRLTYKSYV